MSSRRRLLASLAIGLLAFARPSQAQKVERTWRVGVLGGGLRPTSPDMDAFGGLVRGLHDLGYVEGRNLTIEWRFAEGAYERLPALATELLKIPVDVLLSDGFAATKAAQEAGGTTPIVFGSVNDPVGTHLVASFSRPGGRTTGISTFAVEGGIGVKQLEMLLLFAPKTSTVAVLANPGNPTAAPIIANLVPAAATSKVSLVPLHAGSATEIDKAFAEMKRHRVGALIWIRDAFLNSQRCQIAERAAANRLPAIGAIPKFAECGGLISYGSNGFENNRRAASLIDKVLKGANPGDVPVEQPTKMELLINRKTAKALGLTIPPDLLLLADKVIE